MSTVTGVGQIAINVQDLGRATAFYRDTLGLRHLFTAPPGLAFFDCGGVRLMLEVPEDPAHRHPASILYYKVAAIETPHHDLVSRGAKVVREPHLLAKMPDHDLWMSFYEDGEGNTLALMCEVQPPAPR